MSLRSRNNTPVGMRIGMLILVTGLIAWAPPRAGEAGLDRNHRAVDCPINISASNSGRADIWIMFYESQVKRQPLGAWRQLKIQNHRVAPGATIKRTYTAPGGCAQSRSWRFKLKQGTNFYSHYTHSKTNYLQVGDLAKFF